MTEYETILVETRGRVGWITLNRPEALNALNSQVMHDIVAAASAFDADEGIGAIVVTGSERAFAAGADIKEMESKSGLDMVMGDHFGGWARFAAVRTPVIAAVSGYALGGGCELAMMCDIILAADTAKFGQPEINLGVIPGMGGSQRLIRAVGYYKAAELLLTGRMMDAAEAERAGLVSRVVPGRRPARRGRRRSPRRSRRSRCRRVYAAKAALDAAMETPLAEGLRFERHVFAALFDTADQKEGHGGVPREARPRLHEPVTARCRASRPRDCIGAARLSGVDRGLARRPSLAGGRSGLRAGRAAAAGRRSRRRPCGTARGSARARPCRPRPAPGSAKTSAFSAAVARSTRSRPASVSTSIAARPSTGCGSRTTRPSRTSRSTVFVTLVGCTCSRAMALAIGIRPSRVKPSRRSISYRANDRPKGLRVASMRASMSCWARMIEVTADMPAAASVQPCAVHWRFASAIGSTGSGPDLGIVDLPSALSTVAGRPPRRARRDAASRTRPTP